MTNNDAERAVSVGDRVFRMREVEPFTRRDGATLRKFVVRGPRGAQYGCWISPESGPMWINLASGRRTGSVPRELMTFNPASAGQR